MELKYYDPESYIQLDLASLKLKHIQYIYIYIYTHTHIYISLSLCCCECSVGGRLLNPLTL